VLERAKGKDGNETGIPRILLEGYQSGGSGGIFAIEVRGNPLDLASNFC
jgi:hypothetical protein